MPEIVVIGILGTTLDQGSRPKRWDHWRPTVALALHEDLPIARFDLIHQPQSRRLVKTVTRDIERVSPGTRVALHEIELQDPWDFEEVYGGLHDFAAAYPFEPEDEDYFVHITTGTHVAQICLFLLTESHYIPARLIQTRPAKRGDPAGEYSIIDLDLSRYDRLAARFQKEATDDISFLKSGIDTRNAAFNALIERIERVAVQSEDPILLMGPTGAGKSQLARRIFELKKSRRQIGGEFVEVNCGTVRGDAAMSALFGHKRGAFTGAIRDRQGLLRAAHRGLLFLDEVGELGPDEQAMLLRAVEEKRFLPVGSDREVESRFQLICGTNRDLLQEVAAGRYREDLLARINLWTFELPGLSRRTEDIEPNLDYELERYAERTGKRPRFNKEARDRFLAFAESTEAVWKSNFRDLSGAVTRMATLAQAGRITMPLVKEEITRLRLSWEGRKEGSTEAILEDTIGPGAARDIDRFDRVQLAEVIRVCRASPSLSAAGRELFETSRRRKKAVNDADRLRKYLARFGLTWAEIIPKNR